MQTWIAGIIFIFAANKKLASYLLNKNVTVINPPRQSMRKHFGVRNNLGNSGYIWYWSDSFYSWIDFVTDVAGLFFFKQTDCQFGWHFMVG